ncbi:MAG: hypothetical protein H3C46_09790 [Ignavibacteria bacterium]|nr:hypothetical protein [Ignavibacteria bacterium]
MFSNLTTVVPQLISVSNLSTAVPRVLVALFFLLTPNLKGQVGEPKESRTLSNLEVFESLTAEVAGFASDYLKENNLGKNIALELYGDYKVLHPALVNNLIEKGLSVNGSGSAVKILVKNAAVSYGSPFTKSFLGDYYSERTAELSGEILVFNPENASPENTSSDGTSPGSVSPDHTAPENTSPESTLNAKSFRFEVADTVKLSDISQLENRGLPFTSSEIPKEPFWGSITNIAIAAGSTILAVVLFFTVRTN